IVIGSYYISTKESGILIYGLCIAWLLWVLLIEEKAVSKSILLIACSAVGVAITAATLLYIGGGISNILASLQCWVGAIPTNQYAIEYQSGPWYYFLQGFWIVSPVSMLLCFIGIIGTLSANERLQNMDSLFNATHLRAIRGIVLLLIVVMTIAMATPHFQNLRYVSVLYAPFYLISGLGLWYIISAAKSMRKGSYFHMAITLIVFTLIFMAIRDYNAFEKIFIRTGIKDVSIKMLRDYSR
ncbi:MAG: hypothetical protein PHI59_00865, partial [Candidatus Omnitrophica bacterium]|nr:hypothetical protein [Candidatus Omnitrophota bacterium]